MISKHFKAQIFEVHSFSDINLKLAAASTYLRNQEPMEEWTYLSPTLTLIPVGCVAGMTKLLGSSLNCLFSIIKIDSEFWD